MFCTSEGNIAFVSKRGNDEAGSISQIFVAISKASIGLPHVTIINISIPVISQLFRELEIIEILNIFCD